MKTLLIALNSKYIHSSLAPWYLKAACGYGYGEIKVMEFTINDSIDAILADIYREDANVVAFSCYIWNITHVLKLAEGLKKVSPNTSIIFGGPEVSFDGEEVLANSWYCDYVLVGEGEQSLPQLLQFLTDHSTKITGINGLTFRESNRIISNNACSIISDLDSIPSPYTDEMLKSIAGRIVYYESSRGCPFSCSYCLSSTFEGVRYFSMDRVTQDLSRLINAGVRQVKFVDRTFNCSKSRAKDIFKFIINAFHKFEGKNLLQIYKSQDFSMTPPNFHFEAAADLFDNEMLDMLATVPKGLIQFEIGIQTTNRHTLEAISRRTSIDKVIYNVKRIREMENIHLHLDLIAGLPLEDFSSFSESFNDVYKMKPHQLQLGFLKMLKGSRIRAEAQVHEYKYREYPPYEILQNKYLSFSELLKLKGVEEILERYFNSGRFINTLDFIVDKFFSLPFEFYRQFYKYCQEKGHLDRPLASRELYKILMNFMKVYINNYGYSLEEMEIINELLKFDYLSSDNTSNLPEDLYRISSDGFKDKCFEFLKNEANIKEYLPQYEGIPAKQVYKRVHFETFSYDVLDKRTNYSFKREKIVVLFDYAFKNPVTGLYKYVKLHGF